MKTPVSLGQSTLNPLNSSEKKSPKQPINMANPNCFIYIHPYNSFSKRMQPLWLRKGPTNQVGQCLSLDPSNPQEAAKPLAPAAPPNDPRALQYYQYHHNAWGRKTMFR